MLNQQTSFTEHTPLSNGLFQLTHDILHYKYSQQLIFNYRHRIFQQFSRQKDLYQFLTPQQIQGIDFLQFFNSNQNLFQYYSLDNIKLKIKNIILNRVNQDQTNPVHFYGKFFHFLVKYFKQKQQEKKLFLTKKHQHKRKSIELQYLNSKPLTQKKKESQTFSTPNEKQIDNNSQSKQQNRNQDKQQGSLTFLDQVNKQLSFIIQKVNQNKETKHITHHLNKMKCSIQTKRSKKDKKSRHIKQKKIQDTNIQECQQSYGLNKLKKCVKSSDKNKKKCFSKGKGQRNKKNLITLTPKPRYERNFYGQTQVSSHIKFSITKKSNSKDRNDSKPKKYIKGRKSIVKLSTSSKSKLLIKNDNKK